MKGYKLMKLKLIQNYTQELLLYSQPTMERIMLMLSTEQMKKKI